MEEIRGDIQGNVVRPLRQGGGLKSTLSGKSTPRGSPSFRRLHSGRTPRKESRSSGGGIQWFRSNRLIYWLLLITLWAYLGFYVQSRWAHGDNGDAFLGFGRKQRAKNSVSEHSQRRNLVAENSSTTVRNGTYRGQVDDDKKIDVVLAKKESASSKQKVTPKRKSRRGSRGLRSKARSKQKTPVYMETADTDEQEPEIPMTNSTYGMLVGPFGSVEDRILGWSPYKRTATCDRKGDFARLVWSRKFLLVFHELSMTGAPLSMMELATELLSCGATVKVVVLSKKGGLLPELARRRIRVLEDKGEPSFKAAMKVDLVIAGSAVCASWIEQYFNYHPAGASQIAWWIMENRREYFDRAKVVLNRVKMLIFLSGEQSKQWLTWCEEEKIKLRSTPALVPLSVNDEMAFVAGFACTLNTPTFSTEKMLEKRQLLREFVRKEMGLLDNDMLVMTLSSINPGKGQLLLVESASLALEQLQLKSKALEEVQLKSNSSIKTKVVKGLSKVASKLRSRSRSRSKQRSRSLLYDTSVDPNDVRKMISKSPSLFNSLDDSDIDAVSISNSHRRKLSSTDEKAKEQTLKVLIGSVGSKSNKLDYVRGILGYLSEHSNMSKSVLWTPATIRVAALYSAADVYVINSQGLGETFGRVTIEAMAFGLPVLGTDAGGTKEIVYQNVTGLLHPVGRPGIPILAQDLQFLLKNRSIMKQMGMEGRKKVEKMYLKRHMYKRFVEVLTKCMRP